MGKKRKRHGGSHDVGMEKPDWAMDREPVISKAKLDPTAGQESSDAKFKEFLSADTLGKLTAMKATLSEAQALASDKKAAGKERVKQRAQKQTEESVTAPDENLSFAEMFDPQPEDEVTFEDMLGESKLDWRAFKD